MLHNSHPTMSRFSLAVILILFALSGPVAHAQRAVPPKEAVGPVKTSPVVQAKKKGKLTQRATVKPRKRGKFSRSTPITAKTPVTPPPIPAANLAAAPPAAPPARLEVAYFGAGCFWCLDGLFQALPGVQGVVSGYAGGTVANPTYQQVLTGTTGHAEVVQITYDPAKLSYQQLLDNFWDIHDPTQVDRQGADIGPQYRSIILYRNEAEQEAAEKSKAANQRTYRQPIATQIVPLDKFWVAEDFHQDYFARHPGAPYCQLVIRPKLEKFQKTVGRK